MQLVKPYIPLNALKMIYHSYFPSVMTYGLLFGGHSSDNIKIFQNKIIKIMMGCRNSDSCRNLFFNLEILPLPPQYILSILLFMIKNRNQFMVKSEIYHIDTRQHANFKLPSVNLTKYQKGVYYLGVKVINMLPSYIKVESDNTKKILIYFRESFIQQFFSFIR